MRHNDPVKTLVASQRSRARSGLAAIVTAIVLMGVSVALASQEVDPPATAPGRAPIRPPVQVAAPTPTDGPDRTAAPRPTPAPEATRDPLTGGRPSDAEVFAVKIENTAAARPQVGLGAADIVVVQEVEGRLTRLVAIYHSRFPRRIGPVRSARTTDVRLLPLFGRPGLVYSGANRRVQRNLDRSALVAVPRYTRDPSRSAPHNVMVNLAKVARTVKAGRAERTGWTFAAEDPRWATAREEDKVVSAVGADPITFDQGRRGYVVRWRGQTYPGDGARANRPGALTTDPLTTKNVVLLSVRNRADGNADVTGAASVLSDTVGRGKVVIHRDGKRRTGTWVRRQASGPMRFTDARGEDISLAPGPTWLLLRG